MRSFWMRSIITTSAPSMPVSMEVERAQPSNSAGSGISASGATMRMSVCRACAAHARPSAPRASAARRRRWRWKTIASALVLQDRQRIEQALGGMRHMRLAGRQHADMRRHVRATRSGTSLFGVAQHEHIHVQRLERVHGVEHALALHARGQLHLDAGHVGAEALAASSNDTRVRVEGSVNMWRP
jgi:hypothetical protein